MTSIIAEYEYFKEFQDFCIGHNDDGSTYYNGVFEEDEKEYFDKLSELSEKLKLEIEMNLICFSDSKSKSRKCLERIIAKLVEARDKLDEYEYEARELIIVPGGVSFIEKLWNHHVDKLEILLSYFRNQLQQFETHKIDLKGGESIEVAKIIWESEIPIRKLYMPLTSTKVFGKPFIDKSSITLIEFEKHFIRTTETPTGKINWLKDQYLLTYLFDLLLKEKFLHKSFKSTSAILLSKHFKIKSNDTTPKLLSSTKGSFSKKTGTSSAGKKQSVIDYLERIVKELVKKTETPSIPEKNGFDNKINRHSANSRV